MRVCCKRCNECEMLIEDESIVIIDKNGFNEKRRVADAVKCMKFGQYAFNIAELPESQLLDDMIWR